MAFTATPGFVQSINVGFVQIATANTNLNGTGTAPSLFTAGSNGSMIFLLTIKAIVTTTAGMIRFYVSRSSTLQLFHEESVSAITPSATVRAFEVRIPINFLVKASEVVHVSTEKAETFNVWAFGGDY